MTNFLGGSAYTMARDIADGYHTVTARSFKTMTRPEIEQLSFELDRCLREIRAEQPPQDDVATIKQRNRKIQRLNTAAVVLRNYRQTTLRT